MSTTRSRSVLAALARVLGDSSQPCVAGRAGARQVPVREMVGNCAGRRGEGARNGAEAVVECPKADAVHSGIVKFIAKESNRP